MTQPSFRSLVLVCESLGATQQISFLRPLKDVVDVQVVLSGHVKAWIKAHATDDGIDAIVVSRDTTTAGTDMSDWAKSKGIPVIYHVDDDLLEVPLSLGPAKYKHYADPLRVAQLRRNMEAADLIYASTSALRDRFIAHGISCPIYDGTLYCSVPSSPLLPPVPATGPVFGYMGTAGHAEDLEEILPAIEQVLQAYPIAEFEVFGTIALPESLSKFGTRVRHHKGVADYQAFLQQLHNLGWWVGLAPISDNPFNRCKADTKWVEYTLAGMAVVAADLPVYHRACAQGSGVLAGSVSQWADAILSLLGQSRRRKNMVHTAQQKLTTDYTEHVLQAQILDVLKTARHNYNAHLSSNTQ